MNSGCYNNDISKVLSIQVIDKNSEEIEIKRGYKVFYRGCNLTKDLIIISAKLKELKAIKIK